MTVVAVTQRVTIDPAHGEVRDALAHDWARYLARVLPGRPWVPVPTALPDPGEWAEQVGVGLLLLSAGNDLGESDERDASETRLLEWAVDRGRPVLGVCRGMQLINAVHGGSVRPVSGHVAVPHGVEITESMGDHAPGNRLVVNSFHDFGIAADDLAPDLSAWAIGDDGLVEGLRDPLRPVIGLQWHPERPHADQAATDELIRSFVAEHAAATP